MFSDMWACELHPDSESRDPCPYCLEESKKSKAKEERLRKECEQFGHMYAGKDENGPRCFCGLRTDFTKKE